MPIGSAAPGQKMAGPSVYKLSSPANMPPWERQNPGIQCFEVTQGCSHNACRFCTFFKNVPFAEVDQEGLEAQVRFLAALSAYTPTTRIFLQGGNPFVLSYDKLMKISELLHDNFPQLESIGGYGRITDLEDKSVEQLNSLYHDGGFEKFYFGVETADENLLKAVNKGIDVKTLYEQSAKLAESDMPWVAGYMLGLGGAGYGDSHPIKSAAFFNEMQPDMIGGVSTTLIYDTYSHYKSPMMVDAEEGRFTEAGERERYEELRVLIEHLECPTVAHFAHSTMPHHLVARIPEHKEEALEFIDGLLENFDERRAIWFRKHCVEAV